MTDEEWIERNKGDSEKRGVAHNDTSWLNPDYVYYRGYRVAVPGYLIGVKHSNSAFKAFENQVKSIIDNRLGGTAPTNLDKLYNKVSEITSDSFASDLKDLYEDSGLKSIVDTGKSIYSQFVGSGSSGSGVSSGSSGDISSVSEPSTFDSYLTYLNYLKEINEANNAFNVEQAQKQMDFQAEQNKIFMDFNALEAQKSRDWQTEMSNTAFQRQVADMQAAGLNPVLAASGGNGASIGSGTAASAAGAASGSKATADNLYGSAMLSMMNSAMNVAEKSATAAISANAVASRGISSDTGLNLKSIISGVKDAAYIFKTLRSIFS